MNNELREASVKLDAALIVRDIEAIYLIARDVALPLRYRGGEALALSLRAEAAYEAIRGYKVWWA